MITLPEKIVSGGQTGADMGALIAARELGIPTGGIAPRGWFTENGPREELLRSFGLAECEEEGFPARTRRNVSNTSGTLLVGEHRTGGSRLTRDYAEHLKKPLFLLRFRIARTETDSDRRRIQEFHNWLRHQQIQVLNVAGNRESQSPGIAEFTRRFLLTALDTSGGSFDRSSMY
jgi:Circularly permutated YpsA SLOG family